MPIVVSASPEPAFRDYLDETCESSFSVRATLKPDPRSLPNGRARLAFNWQKEESGYFLQVRKEGVQLFRYSNGSPAPVSSLKPWKSPPGEQVSVTLQRRARLIRCIINGTVALAASDERFKEGRIGVWTSAPEMSWQEVRYQPVQPIHFEDDFMRAEGEQNPWQAISGTWGLHGARGEPGVPPPGLTANPFTYRGTTEKGKALAIAGHWYWDHYGLAVAVKPEDKGAVGLVACYQNPSNYLLFRWTRGLATGRRELLAVHEGKETLLRSAPGGYQPNQWYWLELRSLGDRLEAYVDRQLAVSAESQAFGQGGCGLYVEGDGTIAQFDDACVGSATPQDAPAPFPSSNAVPEHFVKDKYLHEWATEEGAWDRSPGETYWHRGEFFSDPTLSLRLPPSPSPGARVWATLSAAQPSRDSGYRLEVQRVSDPDRCVWILFRNSSEVRRAETPYAAPKAERRLRFQKSGKRVTAGLDDEVALTYDDAHPLQGRKLGYGLEGWPVPPVAASAACAHLEDYTFSSAPVQWQVQRGVWDTEPHWACTGRGAHLMGMDPGAAVLWSKESFSGDLLIEAFMTNAQLPDHFSESPRQLNFTLCGDGVNLSNGYSFLFGGSDGKEVRILKGGKEVARCPIQSKRTGAHNTDVWFYVRVEKKGPLLSFSVDGDRIAEYLDPAPLREGRLAFWTYATGVVLGRVRLWYERKANTSSPSRAMLTLARAVETEDAQTIPAANTEVAASDFEADLGAFRTRDHPDAAVLRLDSTTAARGKRSLQVLNRASGGRFAVWTLNQPVDVTRFPVVSFDYKVPPNVKVNLYAKVAGRWQEFGFTAPQKDSLGVIEKAVADNRWHRCTFNLLEALKKLPESPRVVEGLAFASPEDFGLRAGLTGNPLGVSYHLDNFTLVPSSTPVASTPGTAAPVVAAASTAKGGS